MKLFLIVLAVLCVIAAPAFCALDATLVSADLKALLNGVGTDMLAAAQQSSLMGDSVGDAALGDFPHMYFGVATGTVFANGFARVIDASPSPFQVLNVSGIVSAALSGSGSFATGLYTLSRTFFLYPNGRISFGFGLAGGFEVTGQVSFWPQLFTDGVAGLAGLSGLTFKRPRGSPASERSRPPCD